MRSPVHPGAYSGRAMPRDAVGSSGYLSLSEIHSFSFRTLRAGGGEGEWRGEWSARGSEAGDTTGSSRVLPRANDIVTITVTTYPSTEWWRVTACLDSAKPRGSKIHWSGGCDPAVSMLLGRYVWLATLQRTYHPRPSSPVSVPRPSPSHIRALPSTVATLFRTVHPTALRDASIRPRYTACHFVMYRRAVSKAR